MLNQGLINEKDFCGVKGAVYTFNNLINLGHCGIKTRHDRGNKRLKT